MKKLFIIAVFTLSMFAARTHKSEGPLPTCDPCPFVR